MSFLTFDEPALLAILERNYEVKRKTLVAAQPDLLDIAKNNCSVGWGGQLNPAPGSASNGTGVYLRSGEFVRTLHLDIFGPVLEFSSNAIAYRKNSGSFAYGQALIDGGHPFKGPYKLLPSEFYV